MTSNFTKTSINLLKRFIVKVSNRSRNLFFGGGPTIKLRFKLESSFVLIEPIRFFRFRKKRVFVLFCQQVDKIFPRPFKAHYIGDI
jgi:hypothetical protein